MNCERKDLAIAKLAGGDLSGWRAARLQRHFAGCARCTALYDELRDQCDAAHSAHSRIETSGGDSLADDVLSQIDNRQGEVRRRKVSRHAIAGAVFALALIGAVILQIQGRAPVVPNRSSMPTESNRTVTQLSATHAMDKETATPYPEVVIRMVTNNPEVVILWLGDSAGG